MILSNPTVSTYAYRRHLNVIKWNQFFNKYTKLKHWLLTNVHHDIIKVEYSFKEEIVSSILPNHS